MIPVVIYLLLFLMALIALGASIAMCGAPAWLLYNPLLSTCAVCGGTGGVLYCLRGVYLNYSVRKTWDKSWLPWYFIRPVASVVTGSVSYLFLRAGLLVLEAQSGSESSNLGFYALAFIAGLNVDKFISKLEDIAQATWGIEKSRASKDDKNA